MSIDDFQDMRGLRSWPIVLLRVYTGVFFAYYGFTGNDLWLRKFGKGVKRVWQKWLHRRSRSSTAMPWDRFNELLQRYRLPSVRVVHSIYAAKP